MPRLEHGSMFSQPSGSGRQPELENGVRLLYHDNTQLTSPDDQLASGTNAVIKPFRAVEEMSPPMTQSSYT